MERLKSWPGEKKIHAQDDFSLYSFIEYVQPKCTWTLPLLTIQQIVFFSSGHCAWNVAMQSNGNITCDSVFSRDSERCGEKTTIKVKFWTISNIIIVKGEGWLIVKAQEKICFCPITVDVMDKNLLSTNSNLKIYLNNSWFHFHLPKHQPRMVGSAKITSLNICLSGFQEWCHILDICSTRVRYRWWFTVSAAAFVTIIITSIGPSLFWDFSLRTETDIRCQCQVLVGSRHFKTCSITFLKYS